MNFILYFSRLLFFSLRAKYSRSEIKINEFYFVFLSLTRIFAENKRFIMATYTITLNERSSSGKALVHYLQALGVLISKVSPKSKSSYQRSQEDIKAGRVEQFSSSEEMFKSLGI